MLPTAFERVERGKLNIFSGVVLRMLRLGGVFLALGLLFSGPAAAKILFVCAAPIAGEHASTGLLGLLAEPVRVSATPNQLTDAGQIALVHDTGGYDIRLNYGERVERSLRGDGADILATNFGSVFVHVIVSHDEKSSEHFIFSEEHDGMGSLLWGASTEGTAGNLDRHALCVLPR